jgi:hypothetical protein
VRKYNQIAAMRIASVDSKEATKTIRQTTNFDRGPHACNQDMRKIKREAQNQTGGTKSQVKKIYCRWMEQHADEIVLDASHLIKQPKLHKFIQNSL